MIGINYCTLMITDLSALSSLGLSYASNSYSSKRTPPPYKWSVSKILDGQRISVHPDRPPVRLYPSLTFQLHADSKLRVSTSFGIPIRQ
jgi:hypothetical protein